MKGTSQSPLYWDKEAQVFRYKEPASKSPVLSKQEVATDSQNSPVISTGDTSLDATRALLYDKNESVLDTTLKGWRFRQKAKTLDKNLQKALAVFHQRRELMEAHRQASEKDGLRFLETDLKQQELETKIAKEKLEQAQALNEIKTLEQEEVEKPKLSYKEQMKLEKERATAEMETEIEMIKLVFKAKGELEQVVREAYPRLSDEEVEDMVDRKLVEVGLKPD